MSLWPVVVAIYGLALLGVSLYGLNHAVLCVMFWRHRRRRRPLALRSSGVEPMVTIELPLYNEWYVAERVIRSACEVDYPAQLLEIQVLDDSTDETLELTRRLVTIIRRVACRSCISTDRTGAGSRAARSRMDSRGREAN